MRLAFSSDNHLDINRVDVDAAAHAMAAELRTQQIDYYVNTGDTFNDMRKTRAFYAQLQELVGSATQVRYLAGNHDMIRGTDYAELEGLTDPLYLHNRAENLPGTDWTLVGNNGWYDYSFAPAAAELTPEALWHWKKAYWIDGVIDQPQTDQERMAVVLQQVAASLRAAIGRRVLFATHFVPRAEFLNPRMLHDDVGAKAAAMLGSARLGLLLQQNAVAYAAFGHLHHRDAPRVLDGTEYLHTPVGYGTARRHEWNSSDFMTEWRATLQVVDLQ